MVENGTCRATQAVVNRPDIAAGMKAPRRASRRRALVLEVGQSRHKAGHSLAISLYACQRFFEISAVMYSLRSRKSFTRHVNAGSLTPFSRRVLGIKSPLGLSTTDETMTPG